MYNFKAGQKIIFANPKYSDNNRHWLKVYTFQKLKYGKYIIVEEIPTTQFLLDAFYPNSKLIRILK